MIVKTYVVPPIDNNNYLIIDENTKDAALIDCSALEIWDKVPKGYGRAGISTVGENRGEIEDVNLKFILLTHGHFDHIAGIRPNNEIPVYVHSDDLDLINDVNNYLPLMGMPEITIPVIHNTVKEGDILNLGDSKIEVLHTAGHTKGGVCYYTDGKLFSGDTIFRESVGRCNLPGGDFDKLVNNIETKIFTLPDETEIYPGHGKPTTVGWEKVHNCFM